MHPTPHRPKAKGAAAAASSYRPLNDPPPEPSRPRAPPAASEDLRMWKEHMRVASTDIMAPALSNSPQ